MVRNSKNRGRFLSARMVGTRPHRGASWTSGMIYTFERFRLDVERRELYRDGVQLKVRPKVFDMLTALIDQRDRVMSKDDLLAQLWPGRIVSETTLSSCIKELRKLLDDSGKQQKIIKTVHGRGFRFVAVLADPGEADIVQPTAPEPPQPPGAEPQPAPAPTPSVLSPAGGEHKTVSALRCALVDADGVAEQLGAEALHYLLQDLFALSQDIIGRFDGQVTQWLSDGFLALFGCRRRSKITPGGRCWRLPNWPGRAALCAPTGRRLSASALPAAALSLAAYRVTHSSITPP